MVYIKDQLIYFHLLSADPFFSKENVNYGEVFFSHLSNFQTQDLYPSYVRIFLSNYLQSFVSLTLDH